ncbi:hypothetical protein V8E55_002573 [Tylopilus felleus]
MNNTYGTTKSVYEYFESFEDMEDDHTLALSFKDRLDRLRSKRQDGQGTSTSSGLAISEMKGPSWMDVNPDVAMLAPMNDVIDLTMDDALPQLFTEYSNNDDDCDRGPKWKGKSVDRRTDGEGEGWRAEDFDKEKARTTKYKKAYDIQKKRIQRLEAEAEQSNTISGGTAMATTSSTRPEEKESTHEFIQKASTEPKPTLDRLFRAISAMGMMKVVVDQYTCAVCRHIIIAEILNYFT